MTVALPLSAANNATWQFGPLALVDPNGNTPLALPATTVIRMQLRAAADAVDLVLDLSTESENEMLIADANASTVRGLVPLAKMRGLAAGSYAYDIVVTQPTGRAIRTHAGLVTIEQGVTR